MRRRAGSSPADSFRLPSPKDRSVSVQPLRHTDRLTRRQLTAGQLSSYPLSDRFSSPPPHTQPQIPPMPTPPAPHSTAALDRRSRMATRLKYGAKTRLFLADARAMDIPFPAGLAPVPTPITPAPGPTDPLPQVDVIAMMDTGPESRAMADVLTPGVDATDWYPY